MLFDVFSPAASLARAATLLLATLKLRPAARNTNFSFGFSARCKAFVVLVVWGES